MTARQIKRRKYGTATQHRAALVSSARRLWGWLPVEVRNPRFFVANGIKVSQ